MTNSRRDLEEMHSEKAYLNQGGHFLYFINWSTLYGIPIIFLSSIASLLTEKQGKLLILTLYGNIKESIQKFLDPEPDLDRLIVPLLKLNLPAKLSYPAQRGKQNNQTNWWKHIYYCRKTTAKQRWANL